MTAAELEAWRNSPEALLQRLANCEIALLHALEEVGRLRSALRLPHSALHHISPDGKTHSHLSPQRPPLAPSSIRGSISPRSAPSLPAGSAWCDRCRAAAGSSFASSAIFSTTVAASPPGPAAGPAPGKPPFSPPRQTYAHPSRAACIAWEEEQLDQ